MHSSWGSVADLVAKCLLHSYRIARHLLTSELVLSEQISYAHPYSVLLVTVVFLRLIFFNNVVLGLVHARLKQRCLYSSYIQNHLNNYGLHFITHFHSSAEWLIRKDLRGQSEPVRTFEHFIRHKHVYSSVISFSAQFSWTWNLLL